MWSPIVHYSKSALYISGRAGHLSPCSVCLGCFECANSLIGIASWCADDGQCLQLWWGPVGGLCPKCALWGLMQLHHHSSEPVDTLPVDVWGFGQSVQCIPYRYPRYGVYNPLLLVQWDWVFGVYQQWWRIIGQKTTLMFSCVRIRLTASERPCM